MVDGENKMDKMLTIIKTGLGECGGSLLFLSFLLGKFISFSVIKKLKSKQYGDQGKYSCKPDIWPTVCQIAIN